MTQRRPLEDLPKFSRWPARLLGLEPWEQRHKTRAAIDREYETESWGAYLERIVTEGREQSATRSLLDNWQCSSETSLLYSVGDDLFEGTFGEAYARYLEAIADRVASHLPASALVELGCGFGSVLLHLAADPRFEGLPLVGAEYTPSGRRLTEICARNEGAAVQVARCDFTASPVISDAIPEDALVFTTMATSNVPRLAESYVRDLCAVRPKLVLQFEPVYEHFQGSSLLDLMRRRYVEVNDYNRNLLTLLQAQQDAGRIRLDAEEPAVFGVNPLFPISYVAWAPSNRS